MKNNMEILHITPFFAPNIGGVETHLLDLLKKSSASGINSIVITYQPVEGDVNGKTFEKNKGVEIHRIKWFKGLYYKTQKSPLLHFLYLTPRLLLASITLLSRKKKEISVVHAHGINAAYCGAVVAVLFKKPLVVSMHVDFHMPKGFLKKFILWPLTRSDAILVLTDHSREELINNGISSMKIKKYSYWVDQKIFRPINKNLARKKIGIDDRFTILYVGRLTEEKGVGKIAELAEKFPEVQFLVIGSGILTKDFKKYSTEFKNINFLGRVDNSKLPLYYNASNILLVPSEVSDPRSVFEEGVPRVILEALSCGLPFLGTDNGGIKEVLKLGSIGYLIEDNFESMVKTIGSILSKPKILHKLSTNALTISRENFNESVAERIISSYFQFEVKKKADNLLLNTGDMALKRRSEWIFNCLSNHSGTALLDVGCGDGFYLNSVSQLFPAKKLIGTDFDKRSLQSAEKNIRGKNIKLVWADLMKSLPFETNSFDEVVMSEVTEHLPYDVKGLKEVYRVLKPGGIACITVPHANYPFLWDPINWTLEHLFDTHFKIGFFAGIWNQHERLYTKDQIKDVVKKAGFEVIEQKYITWWCLPFSHYLINIGARILVKGGGVVAQGANKFKPSQKRSLLPSIYFGLAETVDKLNDIFPVNSGVSVLTLAFKPRK